LIKEQIFKIIWKKKDCSLLTHEWLKNTLFLLSEKI
jgi:hypothetical protein